MQGKNEWRNIQEVVRQAIVSLCEANEKQAERISELEFALQEKSNREDVTAALAQKASIYELKSSVKKLENVLLGKADEEAVVEQHEGLQTALAVSASQLGDALDTKADTAQIRAWLDQAEQRMTSLHEKLIRCERQGAERLAAVRGDIECRLGRELDRLESNMNASLGEGVSAGIEQVNATALATGESLRSMVASLREEVGRDVAAIREEHSCSDARMRQKFAAAMEQNAALKGWREQQNTRMLEMQAAIASQESRCRTGLARAEKALAAACEALREDVASALAAEAKRWEGAMRSSTAAMQQRSASGFASARASLAHELTSIMAEVDELRREASLSRSGSIDSLARTGSSPRSKRSAALGIVPEEDASFGEEVDDDGSSGDMEATDSALFDVADDVDPESEGVPDKRQP